MDKFCSRISLFPVAVLVMVSVGCLKLDSHFGETDKISQRNTISFAPRVIETKGSSLPESNSSAMEVFPISESFNVMAFADPGTGKGVNYSTPLMNDVSIAYQTDRWEAVSGTYTWPSTGTVDFHAYYPGSLNASFVQGGNYDYIDIDAVALGKTVGNQTEPFVARALSQISEAKPLVGMAFKHIASQIVVSVYDATEKDILKGNLNIEKVILRNIHFSGDYSDSYNCGKGIWTNLGPAESITLFSGNTPLPFKEKYVGVDGLTDEISNTSTVIVIPESLIKEQGGQVLDITYSVNAFTLNSFEYPAIGPVTASIPLYGKVSGNRLSNGKRYVFHIGISLDDMYKEISFAPGIVGWETENVSAIIIDAYSGEIIK